MVKFVLNNFFNFPEFQKNEAFMLLYAHYPYHIFAILMLAEWITLAVTFLSKVCCQDDDAAFSASWVRDLLPFITLLPSLLVHGEIVYFEFRQKLLRGIAQ